MITPQFAISKRNFIIGLAACTGNDAHLQSVLEPLLATLNHQLTPPLLRIVPRELDAQQPHADEADKLAHNASVQPRVIARRIHLPENQ